MLTTLLDRLTGLTSKYFVLGAFVPVLVFAFLNGTILYFEFDWFRAWARPQISVSTRVFDLVVVLIGLAVTAYVLWSISGFLRQVLEGGHFPHDSILARRLRIAQLKRFRQVRDDYHSARDTVARINRGVPAWRDRLVNAAKKGHKEHQGHNEYDGATGDATAALLKLRDNRNRAVAPSVADLEHAVAKLETLLAENDISAVHTGAGRRTLSDARLELYILFDYAQDEWMAREVMLANRLQSRFGVGAVAPTAFGNVAGSMQSYALSRYQLNLTTFWSRLQALVQKQQDFYGVLQDGKVQLDFLVSCVFLSALTTVFWLVTLPILSDSVWLFLAVAVFGPLVTRLFYLSATENYVAFGEMVRTSIDLYRFDLLDALHVIQPRSLRDERMLWDALQRVSSFGQEWVDLSYIHEDQGPQNGAKA